MSAESVSKWIELLKRGDEEGARKVFELLYPQLKLIAQRLLAGMRKTAEDEEDVAASALKSLLIGLKEGRFPNLTDEDSLWRLIYWMTARKAIDRIRKATRRKEIIESDLGQDGSEERADLAHSAQDPDPTPDLVAALEDSVRTLMAKLEQLGQHDLVDVARLEIEGCHQNEIAEKLGVAPVTVRRARKLIRRVWTREIEGEQPDRSS